MSSINSGLEVPASETVNLLLLDRLLDHQAVDECMLSDLFNKLLLRVGKVYFSPLLNLVDIILHVLT